MLISLSSCKRFSQESLTLKRIEGKQIAIDKTLKSDSSLESYITPYRDSLEGEMNAIIAFAPVTMINTREGDETLLGNFMADLCQKRAQEKFSESSSRSIDFTLLNIGGLRASINKGKVRVNDAFQVMPFENLLVVAELDYKAVRELLDYLAIEGKPHPVSKQLKVVFDGNQVRKVLINGRALDKNKTYMVLTNDYLLNGGDRMNFFQKAINVYPLNYKIRNALLDELNEIDTIKVALDKRVIRH